jgi:N4-gp56 family major capsid protein
LIELGNGVQTLTLSQDKAFTFSVDRGNLEDSQMVTEANKAVKRQIREVSVPNTDIYRLTTLQAYAVANSQSATAALTTSNAYNKFLAQNDAMTDAQVPEDGRWCFMTPATYSLLKQDSTFNKACDTAYQDLKKGIIGQVDGVMLVKVPTIYLPANTGYLFVHEETLISPVKFNSVRVLTEQRGIDGAVAEGRRYYDAFIPTNKGKAIRVHMTA